jgi:predicted dehydrogenase
MGARHAEVLAGFPDVDLVGVLDAHCPPESAIAAALALGARSVVIATPASTHAGLIEAGLGRDLHLLVEKPLATSREDATALQAMVDGADVITAVGHVERFSTLLPMGEWLSGDPIVTQRGGPRPMRIQDVGVLLDLAVHDVDLVRTVTKRDYETSSVDVLSTDARGVDVEARISGRLDDGTTVTHHVSWQATSPVRSLRLGSQSHDIRPSSWQPALTAQDRAFVDACVGGRRTALATIADGAAAVAVVCS